jgi:hypothetical protein
MKTSDKAYAMLYVGQTVGIELPEPTPDQRAWLTVLPRVKNIVLVGGEPVERESDYRGVGDPIFRVLKFDIATSAVECPTYDYDHYMSNVQRIEIANKDGFDNAIAALDDLLESWGVDPSKLGPLNDDYPIL